MGICICSCYVPVLYMFVYLSTPRIASLTLKIRGFLIWGTDVSTVRLLTHPNKFLLDQLLDVLNAHFQTVFGINKTQSTLLQLAYFGAYLVWSPFAGIFVRYVILQKEGTI